MEVSSNTANYWFIIDYLLIYFCFSRMRKNHFLGVQCYDVLHLAVHVPRSAQHSSAHHRQPAQHSQHNTIQHSWATVVHLHTRHSNNNHSSDSTTQNSTWQNSTPIIHRQVHVATHCHGMIQSQIHFATGGVGVNPPQTSLQLVGWESISCKTVLLKGPFFYTKRYVFYINYWFRAHRLQNFLATDWPKPHRLQNGFGIDWFHGKVQPRAFIICIYPPRPHAPPYPNS